MEGLNLNVDIASHYSLAFAQTQIPLIQRLQIELDGSNENGDNTSKLQDFEVIVQTDSDVFKPQIWYVSELLGGHSFQLPRKNISLSKTYLDNLTESEQINVLIEVRKADDVLFSTEETVTLYPKNYWAGQRHMEELLACFVMPNASYVEKLVHKASDLLKSSNQGSQLDGYQSNTRERPYLMAAAIWNVICAEDIRYVEPPASFAKEGQRIRTPDDISRTYTGACLDLSLLFAACFEHIGLNPIIAMTDGHACCGLWLIDDAFGLLTNDDPQDIRKRIASKDIVLFETTLAVQDNNVSFRQAEERAEQLVAESSEDEFVYVIDIKTARKRQITPLPTKIDDKSTIKKISQEGPAALPVVPPLPPVRLEESVVEDTPETRVEKWKRQLLDLTKRNKLLNLSDRSNAVKLYCPDIGQVEDMLADGQIFNFLSSAKTPFAEDARDPNLFRLSAGNDPQVEYALEQLSSKVLVANESEKSLEKNLLNLFRKAKSDLEEGGANTLYLAIGFLKWKETPESTRVYKAPLLLIPVELQRNSARSKIKLKQREDDEPIFNSTLIEFLENDYEVDLTRLGKELPEDESGIDVNLVLSTVREKVKDIKGFEVSNDIILSNFSFAKYLMWKDLTDRVDELKDNTFVKHLIDTPTSPYLQNSEFLNPDDIDDKLKPEEMFVPLNADSSQLVAIAASAKAQDFVLEGPPGTGKSETIANIIAHNIALGRKVLFVAEKMAALNVVHRRLEKVGLDHLCLELHSNKTNKRAVLDQLKKSINQQNAHDQSGWLEEASKLFEIRQSLNSYVKELHKQAAFGLSPRQAISRVARFKDEMAFTLDWLNQSHQAPVKTADELKSLRELTKKIGLIFKDIESRDVKAFQLVKQDEWSNSWQRDFIQSTRTLKASLDNLVVSAKDLQNSFAFLETASTIEDFVVYDALAFSVASVQAQSFNVAFESDITDTLSKLKTAVLLKVEVDEEVKKSPLTLAIDALVTQPVEKWLNDCKLHESKNVISKWFGLRSLTKEMQLAGVNGSPTSITLEQLKDLQNKCHTISEVIPLFEKDRVWDGWSTNADDLNKYTSKLDAVVKSTRTIASASESPSVTIAKLKELLSDGREFIMSGGKQALSVESYTTAMKGYVDSNEAFNSMGGNINAKWTLDSVIENCEQIIQEERRLNLWCNWIEIKNDASKFELEPLIISLESGAISADDSEHQFMHAFCHWLAPILIDESSVLRKFHSTSHESLITEFRELDANLANTTADYISALVSSRRPEKKSEEVAVGHGILSTELNKKSRHKPIRKLIDEMGDYLSTLKPCVMMSPLSVAQFLPTNMAKFDLVVFDEASQITVWDAVGAIARGKNVIVVGDPKQMPPTSFFSKQTVEEESDEEDLESILDQALSAQMKHHRLTGHYRSRHESLIAFSNNHYYESSLVTYPSSDTKGSAVELHRVGGVYSKGKNRNNPIEAQAICDFIVKTLKERKGKNLSLGVVTLNSEQQRCIEDLLDEKRRTHGELEKYFQATDDYDPIFVKNLESVQGDERDIIIMSLGYGPTELGGKTMSMNFGPLNKQGGERRLNVAITRATSEMHIFSSFDPYMIDMSRTSALAVQHLKNFLEFAERGPIALAEYTAAESGVDQFDSYFEEAVAIALRSRGWKIQTQVGVSKFRIDMGIVNPDKPGKYLAGIECDGATYHGSPAARDRDRVRQIILESLGWNIIRIWSTDYFIDSESIIERVHQQLEELLVDDCNAIEEEIVEDDEPIIQPEINNEPDTKRYFDKDYQETLSEMTKTILSEKNGISLKELVSDIGWQHDLARTTQKQVDHIEKVISSWAGITKHTHGEKTVWITPDNVKTVIPWRGIDAFGVVREWTSIPVPEQIGLAQIALIESPDFPVNYIFEEFRLSRRAKKTVEVFESWIKHAEELN
jgi:superfamily I DNA and/or RNA helicase/very-short-patch-repair endonuclease